MELEYELSRYGLEGLRPIEEMEARLQLHGRGGGNRETLQELFRSADQDSNIFYRWVHPDEDSLYHSSISRPNVLYGMSNFAESLMYERPFGPRRGQPRRLIEDKFVEEGGRELRIFEGEDAELDLLLSGMFPEELFIPSRVLYAFDTQRIAHPSGFGVDLDLRVRDRNLATRVQALNRELREDQWRRLYQGRHFWGGDRAYRSELEYFENEFGVGSRSEFLDLFDFSEFEDIVSELELHGSSGSRRFPPTASQQRALEHLYGPAVVIAGPGAGKSFTLTERLRHLTEQSVTDPQQILSLVFGKDAQQDLLRRTRDIGDFDVRTLDAFAYGVVRENFGRLGIYCTTTYYTRPISIFPAAEFRRSFRRRYYF